MIPLVRPLIPELSEIEPHLRASRASGQWSNFGPAYCQAVDALKTASDGWHCLPVSSGTTAIQVALQCHFAPGARIAVPDYTHIGTFQAVIAAHCRPVLAPVNRRTWTIDPIALQKSADQFDGFVVVSPFGYAVDFGFYDDLAKQLDKTVIYDLAGAWGIRVKTENTHCFSLHATKNFSCGEGGLTCFKSEGFFLAAQRLINFATMPDRSSASAMGGNWKIDEFRAAIILAHLARSGRLFSRMDAKKDLLERYQRRLERVCIPHRLYEEGAPSMCVLAGLDSHKAERAAAANGFMAKRYFPLLSQMTALGKFPRIGVSGPFFETCVALPSDVSREEFELVCDTILRVLK